MEEHVFHNNDNSVSLYDNDFKDSYADDMMVITIISDQETEAYKLSFT